MRQRPRPRLLYGAVMAWVSIVGGGFIAPFLKHEARFSDAMVGTVLALGNGLLSLLGPLGGSWADARERQFPNRGRAQVLLVGITLGSLCFLLHGMRYLLPGISIFDSGCWHFVLRLMFACAASLTFPVLDGMVLAHLEQEPGTDRSAYGKERLHGAIWWAVTNLLMGPFLDRFGFPIMYGFAVLSTVTCFISIIVYARGQSGAEFAKQPVSDIMNDIPCPISGEDCSVPNGEDSSEKEEADAPKMSTRILLRIMLGTIYGASFLFYYYCLNAGMSVVESLVFLFFEFLGGTYTMCSVTVVLTVLFEIPIFHYAPAMLNLYGPGIMQIVAGGAYVLRVIGYSIIPMGRAPLALLLEPLHGVTYACSKASGVEFAASLMPAGYEASGQGLLGLFGGFGAVTGLFVGGLTEQTLGPRIMYRTFAVIVSIGMLVFSIASCRKPTFHRVDTVPPKDVELAPCRVTDDSKPPCDSLETPNESSL